jgi:transcriptional regulator with XRE-family HTH domain
VSPRTARHAPTTQIGAAIRARRLALKLRQRDVAERAGLNIHTVWQIERGKAPPTTSSLRRIAEVLDLTLILVDCSIAERLAEAGAHLGLAEAVQALESLRDLKQRADRDHLALVRARTRIAALEAEAASLKAAQGRYEEALDALARQSVPTHDLIDQAREACKPRGRNRTQTRERKAA